MRCFILDWLAVNCTLLMSTACVKSTNISKHSHEWQYLLPRATPRPTQYALVSKCVPESLDLWEPQENTTILNYILFKIVPLCNSALLRATVKVLETFLETILWKPFQLFRRILNNVSSITESSVLSMLTQSMEQAEISWSQVRRVCGMLQCCHVVLY